MTRDHLGWLLALLVLILGGWWLSENTEWVEEERSRPAQGEARDNPVYAFTQLLRRLDVRVERHEALAAMPPPQARLLLLSSDWELVPGRAEQLRQWVLRGGHLVLTQHEDWQDTALSAWVPVHSVYVKAAGRPKPAQAAPRAAAAASGPAVSDRTVLASLPPLWGDTGTLVGCHGFAPGWMLRTKPGVTPTWTLTRIDGTPATRAVRDQQEQALQALQGKPVRPAGPDPQALRVPVGQGSVTVVNVESPFFFNQQALRCDNALLLAAAMQAEPGASVWIYLHEKREALLPWLWHQGWIAIVAGALALAAALWRAAVRFGPRLAPAPRLRRSISEQVSGLGIYLQGGGREALLVAQQRALHEMAMLHLPRFERLSASERVQALAAATGLAPAELATALATRHCTRAQLAPRLQLLEAARRRLHRTPASPPEERHPPS